MTDLASSIKDIVKEWQDENWGKQRTVQTSSGFTDILQGLPILKPTVEGDPTWREVQLLKDGPVATVKWDLDMEISEATKGGKWVPGEGLVYVDPLTGLPRKSLIEQANEKYDAQMIKAVTKKEIKWLPNHIEDMGNGVIKSDREIMYGPGQNPYENTRKAKQEEHYLFGKHYRLIPRWPFIQVTIGHPDIQPVPLWDEKDLV